MAITPWALHVGASNCSNLPTATGPAGTVTDNNLSDLRGLDGPVVTFTLTEDSEN